MIKTNVADAKAKLSEYLDRVLGGERIVICRHNKPVAELRAFEESRVEPRPIGPLPGRPAFDVPPSFFQPLSDEELDLWEDVAVLDRSQPNRPAWGPTRVAESKITVGGRKKRRAPRRRS